MGCAFVDRTGLVCGKPRLHGDHHAAEAHTCPFPNCHPFQPATPVLCAFVDIVEGGPCGRPERDHIAPDSAINAIGPSMAYHHYKPATPAAAPDPAACRKCGNDAGHWMHEGCDGTCLDGGGHASHHDFEQPEPPTTPGGDGVPWHKRREEDRMCEECGFHSPRSRICGECEVALRVSAQHEETIKQLRAEVTTLTAEVEALRAALWQTHLCPTVRADGTCDGCIVGDLLAGWTK